MNLFFKSIRWRLQFWHSLILLIVLSVSGVGTYILFRENITDRVDQELQETASALLDQVRPFGGGEGGPPRWEGKPPPGRPWRSPGGPGGHFPGSGAYPPISPDRAKQKDFKEAEIRVNLADPAGSYYVVWSPTGRIIGQSPDAPTNTSPALKVPALMPVIQERENTRELMEISRRGYRVLVGHDMSAEFAELRRLAWRIPAAGTCVLGLGLLSGWWLASRAIEPIKEISATARKIAAGNLSERINVTDTANEFGQLAQVLNATFGRLQTAFGQQAQFTADASHELRTPVSVLLTQTQSALARPRSELEYREALEACQRAAQRMRHLTESLLALARLDSGEEAAGQVTCDVQKTIMDAVELLRPIANQAEVILHMDLSDVRCLGNSGQLGQAVTNLLFNAIQYNQPGGEVRVLCRREENRAVVVIEDTGVGIKPEDMPHIFKRFYRADKARSGSHGQVGLGLAISKSIIEAHSGEINVRSELGKGTTFTIVLPAES